MMICSSLMKILSDICHRLLFHAITLGAVLSYGPNLTELWDTGGMFLKVFIQESGGVSNRSQTVNPTAHRQFHNYRVEYSTCGSKRLFTTHYSIAKNSVRYNVWSQMEKDKQIFGIFRCQDQIFGSLFGNSENMIKSIDQPVQNGVW